MGNFLLRGFLCAFFSVPLHAAVMQMETRVVNGISDERSGSVAFTGGVIVVAPGDERRDVTLLIQDGIVEGIVKNEIEKVPTGYRSIDPKGAYIYPGLID